MKSHVPKLSYRKFFSWAFALALLLGAVAFFWSSAGKAIAAPTAAETARNPIHSMTDMARIARIYSYWTERGASGQVVGNRLVFTGGTLSNKPTDNCLEDEECEAADPDFPGGFPIPGGQAEYAIAVDSTGQHVVIGFNDTRGFSLSPASLSGFYYSDDGGVTFTDGRQLPIPVAQQTTLAGTKYPQVFGDPDVKYFGGSIFIYSSIMVKDNLGTVPTAATTQTMCVHRSTDFGHTWQGPFEVTGATRPAGPTDAADKEFMDINPSTGRCMITWSNFIAGGVGGVEERATFSDNAATGTPPTWSISTIFYPAAAGQSGQGAMPKFKGDATTVYAVTGDRGRTATDTSGYSLMNEMFAKSTDQGTTWSAPLSLSAGDFKQCDRALGNDRDHSFPSIAVDRSGTATAGFIYVVWAGNALNDGSDISFVRSTDNGGTFSVQRRINARPGNDRNQWFPTVAVDNGTGRVTVTYYDEGLAATGDLAEISVQSSTDGGVNFSKPIPLTFEPFKAAWGNDTGQPNLGDYNMTVAQGGELFSAHAGTELHPFGDGQTNANDSATGSPGNMNVPDLFFRRTTLPARPSLRMANYDFPASGGFGAIKITDSGGNGFIDPGDTVNFQIPLQNYVTNTSLTTPVSAPAAVTGISATISTTTPGVTFTSNTATYANIPAGGTEKNAVGTFVAQISNSFVPGTPIKLTLTVTTAQGTAVFNYTQPTGTPKPVVLLAENFDDTITGALPSGWSSNHNAGTLTIPWAVSQTAFRDSPGNGAVFEQNDTGGARSERLFSPLMNVPANCEYVTVDMDVAYNSEDDAGYKYLGYDGFLLRVLDNTTGRGLLRSVMAEAFEEEFTTGDIQWYPKDFPRRNQSFQDIGAWSGFSNGFKHVHMKFPAASLTPAVGATSLNGAQIQLRFEYEQDSNTSGTINALFASRNVAGVAFDNLVVAAVTSAPAGAPQPNSSPTPTPTPTPSQLVNVSTRARVEANAEIIGGFIITGAGNKNVIIRGLGPSLQNNGLLDFLANPTLELRPPSGPAVTNQDWRDTQEAAIKATGIPPLYDVESAIVASLPAGAYTVILKGLNGGTGLGLIEVYDLATGATTKLANLSTRASVKSVNNVMIGGFYVDAGSGGANVAVRALGPSLTALGVTGALADPTLELRDGDGTLLLSNDDWQDNAGQAAALTAAGMAPSNAKESAVIKFLVPGAYTAIVQGRNGTPTGVGLVEVYNLP
jgi:hypothetical protein